MSLSRSSSWHTDRPGRPVLDELVFVGGCVTGLLISDKAATGVRPTFDVDVITEATTYTEYAHLSERLRKLGFVEDTGEGALPCRWFNGDTRLDVMPLDEKILGFSNPWYVPAIETAQAFELEKGFYIRVLTAPYFRATKSVAFKDRGHGDYLSSHDLEDVITVVDGRPELLAEFLNLHLTTYAITWPVPSENCLIHLSSLTRFQATF